MSMEAVKEKNECKWSQRGERVGGLPRKEIK